MGISYAKWDKMQYSSSEEEEESQNSEHGVPSDGVAMPRVTKFDHPRRITRTVDGDLMVENSTSNRTGEKEDVKRLYATGSRHPVDGSNNESRPTLFSQPTIPPFWTDKGSEAAIKGINLYWCQDRYTATLRLALPRQLSKWTCSVSNLLSYADRFVAIGGARPKLEIRELSEDERILLGEELAYPVHAAEDEETVDWTIETLGCMKYMTITFYKATPMSGVTIWWKRPLEGMLEISLDWREEESKRFQNAWREAHAKFLSGKEGN